LERYVAFEGQGKAIGIRERCGSGFRFLPQRRFARSLPNDVALHSAVMIYWPVLLISAAGGMLLVLAVLVRRG
jgi:hypothetical protein